MGDLEAPILPVCPPKGAARFVHDAPWDGLRRRSVANKARRRGIVVTMPRRSNAVRRAKEGLPLRGRTIFGCDCVSRRWHSYYYAASSFLVSFKNHHGQIPITYTLVSS